MAAKRQQNLRSAVREGRERWQARPVAGMKQLQKVWEGKSEPSGKLRGGTTDEDEKSGHIVAGEYKIAQFKWQCVGERARAAGATCQRLGDWD